MTLPIEIPKLKIGWAEEHLRSLDAELRRYTDADLPPFQFFSYTDNKDGSYVVGCRKNADLPDTFRLIACDAVHNLRASLDYLAYELVIKNGNVPTDATAFPIYAELTAKTFSAVRAVKGMSPAAVQVIDDLQPYKRGNRAKHEPLSVLHELSLIEKHRTLPITAMVANFKFRYPDSDPPMNEILDDGTVLMRFSAAAKAKVEFDPKVAAQIVFSTPGETFDQAPVVSTIRDIYKVVNDGVIPRFARFLA